MKIKLPLTEQQKLQLQFCLEHGALGPDGKNKINAFCQFANQAFRDFEADILSCSFLPRSGLEDEEIRYFVADKALSRKQAKRYLKALNKDIDTLEMELHERLLLLIEAFMGR